MSEREKKYFSQKKKKKKKKYGVKHLQMIRQQVTELKANNNWSKSEQFSSPNLTENIISLTLIQSRNISSIAIESR